MPPDQDKTTDQSHGRARHLLQADVAMRRDRCSMADRHLRASRPVPQGGSGMVVEAFIVGSVRCSS
jgi:hypothetical protein